MKRYTKQEEAEEISGMPLEQATLYLDPTEYIFVSGGTCNRTSCKDCPDVQVIKDGKDKAMRCSREDKVIRVSAGAWLMSEAARISGTGRKAAVRAETVRGKKTGRVALFIVPLEPTPEDDEHLEGDG